jgi:hypothetical protein
VEPHLYLITSPDYLTNLIQVSGVSNQTPGQYKDELHTYITLKLTHFINVYRFVSITIIPVIITANTLTFNTAQPNS